MNTEKPTETTVLTEKEIDGIINDAAIRIMETYHAAFEELAK